MKKTVLFIMIVVTVGISSFMQGNDSNVSISAGSFSSHYAIAASDTTIYGIPSTTAELIDAITYFRQNNKFKDWDKSNSKVVILQGVVEKEGTISGARILRPANVKELDDEALRLIKSAKYTPGKNAKGEDVRSKFTIPVYFPAH